MGQEPVKDGEETQVTLASLAGAKLTISLDNFRNLVVEPMSGMIAGDRLWLIEQIEDVYCFGCGGPAKLSSGMLCPCRNDE